jgi:hypothetical protein
MRLRISGDLLSSMGLVYHGGSQPPVTLAASGRRYRCWGQQKGMPVQHNRWAKKPFLFFIFFS